MLRGPIVALIPARGGSKGIPRKNLVPLAGKPLIHYTFAAARASSVLDRIILSTDFSSSGSRLGSNYSGGQGVC